MQHIGIGWRITGTRIKDSWYAFLANVGSSPLLLFPTPLTRDIASAGVFADPWFRLLEESPTKVAG